MLGSKNSIPIVTVLWLITPNTWRRKLKNLLANSGVWLANRKAHIIVKSSVLESLPPTKRLLINETISFKNSLLCLCVKIKPSALKTLM